MRQLLPSAVDPGAPVDVAATYGVPRPAPPGRPWVAAIMVVSADGSASLDGRSGGLGGPADRLVFATLRARADVVLVAAGTARIEGYRPIAGARPVPIAVVSRRLDLEWSAPFFTEALARPLVVTCAAADPARRARAAEVAEVVLAGEERVDPAAALAELGRRGYEFVVCEGGPSLLGQLVAADVVDEVCLTLSPLLVAGEGPRLLSGPAIVPPLGLRLDHVLEDDGSLFLRYLRR